MGPAGEVPRGRGKEAEVEAFLPGRSPLVCEEQEPATTVWFGLLGSGPSDALGIIDAFAEAKPGGTLLPLREPWQAALVRRRRRIWLAALPVIEARVDLLTRGQAFTGQPRARARF